jgi:tetratricopeptide (TPR) repeat protein
VCLDAQKTRARFIGVSDMSFDLTVNLNLILAITTGLIGVVGSFLAYRANNKKKLLAIHEVLDEAWQLIVGPNRDLDKAKRLIELKANPIKPNFYRTTYVWGVLHDEMQEYKIAEKAYCKCLSTYKKFDLTPESLYENLSRLYIKTERYGKAEAILEKIIDRNINPGFAYYHYGVIALDKKKVLEARDLFLKAIEYDPQSPYSYVNLIAIYLSFGQFEEAEAILDKAIDRNTVIEQTYINGAGLFQKTRNKKRLEEMMRKIQLIKIEKTNGEIDLRYNRGFV